MRIIMALAVSIVACGCGRSELPFYRTAAMTPEWLRDGDVSGPSMHRVGPFALTDQRGARLTNASFAGRVSVVNFFFTSCRDVCPTTTRNIAALLRETTGDERIQILSHSVTPSADSIGALRHFAEERGIRDPRWHLLTGDSAAIDALARQSYFVRLGNDTTYGVKSIAHSESVLLVDRDGRLRGVYAGTLPLEMDRLKEDVETLQAERIALPSAISRRSAFHRAAANFHYGRVRTILENEQQRTGRTTTNKTRTHVVAYSAQR